MSAQRYFPNGNPDYETDWINERNVGWTFLAVSIISIFVHGYWIEHDVILFISYASYGL